MARSTRLIAIALAVLALPGLAQARERKFDLDYGGRQINVKLSDPPSGGLLFDLDDGRVLWARQARGTRPIASLTKLMTALIAVDELKPKERVKVSDEAADQPPVAVGLKAGTRIEADTLLAAALIPSGNDAAVALADGVDRTARRFASTMNDRARRLDLRCTRFRTPSGLSDKDRSCPEDLAQIAELALDEPRIARVVRQRRMKVKIPGRGRVALSATNPLLRENYHGTIGIKTGFTNSAGHCLIAAVKQHGTTLVAILLDSPDTGEQAKKLLEKGFDSR